MESEYKIWKFDDKTRSNRSIVDFTDINSINQKIPTIICFPGCSTTHDKKKYINGYLRLVDNIINGRGYRREVNLISLSYNSQENGEQSIMIFNNHPETYFSKTAQKIAEKLIIPFFLTKRPVNIICKSYGVVLARMISNYLHHISFKTDPKFFRILGTANVARINYQRRDDSTEIIVEGSNDKKAAKLNKYKISAPKNHEVLTITKIDSNRLLILSHINNRIVIRKNFGRKVVNDNERHTAHLYYSPGKTNFLLYTIICCIANDMIISFEGNFDINNYLMWNKIQSTNSLTHHLKSYFIKAINNGDKLSKVQAILFDWDLTLVDGEQMNLSGLNYVFKKMFEKYGIGPKESWDFVKMRNHFQPTISEFYQKVYPRHKEEAIELFRNYRFENIDQVKLLDGSLSLLRHIKNLDVPLAIVSNKEQDELEAQVNNLLDSDIRKYIRTIGRRANIDSKPGTESIYLALNTLGVRRKDISSVVFVGDRVSTDLKASLSAGCLPCLVGFDDKAKLIELASQILEMGNNFMKIQNQSGSTIFWFPSISDILKFMESYGPKFLINPYMTTTRQIK